MSRRLLRVAAWCAVAASARAAPVAPAKAPLDFESLNQRARALAQAPYHPRESRVPDWLRHISYDQYRYINFRPPMSWWNRDPYPFKLQFFHPGFIYNQTVQLYELDRSVPKPIPFEKRFFEYGPLKLGPLPEDLGYAGFRINYALNVPGDELGVFQGASYFRFLCRRAVYGMSSRGVAVNTGLPIDEEFPDFTDFWIQRPSGPQATELLVYALLDGPSVTGAYRFAIVPGSDTVVHIKADIYCRTKLEVLGIAPLTSMFWHGKTSNFETDDVRPEVHDSDGLSLSTSNGEWIWRPLSNPSATRTTSFIDDSPRGFGLMQRERRYEAYGDLEAASQLRPSVWVEPINRWGRGEVRLMEIHTTDETSDNVVAFWKPAELPAPGEPIEMEYDLHWILDQIKPPGGYVTSTRYGKTSEKDVVHFLVDFDGRALQQLAQEDGVEPDVAVGSGATFLHAHAQKNQYNGSWRLGFGIKPDGSGRPVELRCVLKRRASILTETWSYLWQP